MLFFLLSFRFGTVLFFGASQIPPVLLDGGSSSGGGQICQNAEIPPSFMSLPYIFCKRMHLQYIAAFLMSTPWGFAQTPTSLAAPQGQAVKTQPPDPVAECWVGSKASRVKCTASPPLTPFHLCEHSHINRSGRSWRPVKACEATACGLAFTGWRRPNALW